MNWRFTIIDRANVSHVIPEPVGFDSIEIDIKRDENTHGIIFDYQGKDMKYYGDAMHLLKAEYDTYGSQGDMTLVIEQSCDDVLTELYRGKFLFLQYDESIGDECYVKIPIENTGDVIDLTTKWDQKVDLATTVAFDGVTTLAPYSKLGLDLILPSKGLVLTDKSQNKAQHVETVSNQVTAEMPAGWMTIELALTDIAAEIGQYTIGDSLVVSGDIHPGGSDVEYCPPPPSTQSTQEVWNGTTWVRTNPPFFPADGRSFKISDLSRVVNYQEGTTNYDIDINQAELSFQLDGELAPLNSTFFEAINCYLLRVDTSGVYHWLDVQNIFDVYDTPINGIKKVRFSLSYSSNTVEFKKGDSIYFFINAYTGVTNTADIAAGLNTFKITIEPTSFFSLKVLSHTQPSTTKAFLVNEVISRISEAITNNKIKAYSEYFGRTDSQPYSVSANGIGSMEALAKGIYIRNQQNRIVGQPNVFSLSMKDVFEGIEPIHHIGFGIEDDPARSGYKRLRVEHWKHFYTDDLIMSCVGVRNVQRKIVESKHYSTFQFGYEKYEAEQYNGLDEFLTKRTFRTTLNGLKNELNKVSKFIASGYAWEITRRKNTDSSDWRFDNDTFIVCLRDSIILKQGTTVVVVDGGTGSVIQLNDASFVGITPLAIGDKISITNSTNNTGIYTITYIGYDGTVDHIDGWLVRVTVAEVLVSESIELGNYVIERTGGYFVETGNVDSPSNLVDPDTTYNFRISPIRNAMRWMDKIAEGYKSSPSIIFTDGAGNYFASGKMTDSFGRLENAVIAENETIVTATFADATKVDPLLAPEQLTFDFPMSIAEFRNIMDNPYGKIYWENEFESGYGYLSSIKYKPEEGIASFLLIPKI